MSDSERWGRVRALAWMRIYSLWSCDHADKYPSTELFVAAMRSMDELVGAGVRNAGRLSGVTKPRWAHVAQVFAVGSQSAHELCRLMGEDPDEVVGGDAFGE